MPTKRLTEAGIGRLRPAPSGKRDEHYDTVEPGLLLRVTDTGHKSWCLYFYNEAKGKRTHQRRTLGRYPDIGLAEARQLAREAKQAIRQGLAPDHHERQRRRAQQRQRANTFAAVAKLYMDERGNRLRCAGEYQRKLDVDLLPTFGDQPIADIGRAEIREFLVEKAKHAPIAANRLQALLSVVFNYALDTELVPANPIHRMKMPGVVNARERVLTNDELRSVWLGAETLRYPFGTLVRFLILTAQRRGEVAGLTWDEINGTGWRLPQARAKGGTGHIVPLAPQALVLLDEARKAQEDMDPDGTLTWEHVFTSSRADLPISGWSKYRPRLESKLPEPVPDWRLHDLRRTAATGMRSLGVDRLTVSKVLNHAEAGVTKIYDRYAADPEKRRALVLWASHVDRIVRGEPTPENVFKLPLRR